MKKLGKLNINPEKVIKNEELITLRGGYGCDFQPCPPDWWEYCCRCHALLQPDMYISYASQSNCNSLCQQALDGAFTYSTWECAV
jgi:hypothetical protein